MLYESGEEQDSDRDDDVYAVAKRQSCIGLYEE
jgi:hypothetical protein